mmetsp:Transcript_21363/g.45040  ORF Transcript_21363/g.45040 Transcript_21363/m.45040 type:complete len:227 (+) Transcript_21363:220-900(+)
MTVKHAVVGGMPIAQVVARRVSVASIHDFARLPRLILVAVEHQVVDEDTAERRDGARFHKRLQIRVELVDKRHPVRDLEVRNVRIRNIVKQLHAAADRVSMRDDKHVLASTKRRLHFLAPKRTAPFHLVLERLGQRQHVTWQMVVFVIVVRCELRARLDGRRRDVVRARPDLDLLLSKLLLHFVLAPPLQRSVVTLVEPIIFDDGQSRLLASVQKNSQRVLRALQL